MFSQPAVVENGILALKIDWLNKNAILPKTAQSSALNRISRQNTIVCKVLGLTFCLAKTKLKRFSRWLFSPEETLFSVSLLKTSVDNAQDTMGAFNHLKYLLWYWYPCLIWEQESVSYFLKNGFRPTHLKVCAYHKLTVSTKEKRHRNKF